MTQLRALIFPVALTLTIAACGDDNTGTNPIEAVAGTYHATRIDLNVGNTGLIEDALALGASVEIVLTPQGTTSGTLVIPAELTEDGIDDDLFSLSGTFTVVGNTVHFQGQGDNIIPAVPWTIGNGTLTASSAESEGTVTVTLTRG